MRSMCSSCLEADEAVDLKLRTPACKSQLVNFSENPLPGRQGTAFGASVTFKGGERGTSTH